MVQIKKENAAQEIAKEYRNIIKELSGNAPDKLKEILSDGPAHQMSNFP